MVKVTLALIEQEDMMGLLVNGQWQDNWYDTAKTEGAFKRESAQFRNAIGLEPDARFPAEKGRYHLYVSLACPWAHRTLLFRKFKIGKLYWLICCSSSYARTRLGI